MRNRDAVHWLSNEGTGLECSLLILQAGGMDRAKQLPKLRDNENEYLLGYVFAVSGPGV